VLDCGTTLWKGGWQPKYWSLDLDPGKGQEQEYSVTMAVD